MNPDSRIHDPEQILQASLQWEVDPEDVLWLRARYDDEFIYLRINFFPDEVAYSLYLGDGEFLGFHDLPNNWKRVGPLEWPSSARPRENPFWD